MNIVYSELCSFCEAEPETIIHLLCSCRKVKQLWSSVQQWCSKCFSLPDLSSQTAVLGFVENARAHIHQNLILLFFKKFVYEKRELPSQIALPTFIKYLNYIYKIEHKIALKNNTVEKHLKKWETIQQLCAVQDRNVQDRNVLNRSSCHEAFIRQYNNSLYLWGGEGIGAGVRVFLINLMIWNRYSLGRQHCCRCGTYSQQVSTQPTFKLLNARQCQYPLYT